MDHGKRVYESCLFSDDANVELVAFLSTNISVQTKIEDIQHSVVKYSKLNIGC